MEKSQINIGVIGCGAISQTYFEAISAYDEVNIVACADLLRSAAEKRAEQFAIARVCTNEELLADPEVDVILNLTVPKAHYKVTRSALEQGKHVYLEKPLATNYSDGRELMALATENHLRIGVAPDTFLGAGIQTARQLIDNGVIGEPHAGAAAMICRGPESWHPNPEFYYEDGGGPLFDMGPYYLTALIYLMRRPVRRVCASGAITFPQRTVGSGEKKGKIIDVEIPTHLAAVLEFEGSGVATVTMSFDVWGSTIPRIEIYGSEGSLSAPDPNTFGGPVRHMAGGERQWEEKELLAPYENNRRGIGLLEMCRAIRENRPHRANGEMGLHVLEIMEAAHVSMREGKHVVLETMPEVPDRLGN